jgi:membrane-associated phospholipid phosphatase
MHIGGIMLTCLLGFPVHAGNGGFLGIDQRLNDDDHGIWNRKVQTGMEAAVLATVVTGALWNGGETSLGHTFWQAVDSSVFTTITVLAAKRGFSRSRPNQTNDPNKWFKGRGHDSFPSGEVALQASVVTPFIAEYHSDHPWVWALAALPAYDAAARVKTRGHWQTDVLAGLAVGTVWGVYAHHRKSPLMLGVLPHGFTVGFRAQL